MRRHDNIVLSLSLANRNRRPYCLADRHFNVAGSLFLTCEPMYKRESRIWRWHHAYYHWPFDWKLPLLYAVVHCAFVRNGFGIVSVNDSQGGKEQQDSVCTVFGYRNGGNLLDIRKYRYGMKQKCYIERKFHMEQKFHIEQKYHMERKHNIKWRPHIKHEGIDGYMSLEAAFVIPWVIFLFVLLIYVSFYLYDKCVLFQDAYTICFRGSIQKEENGALDYIQTHMAAQFGGKYFGVESVEKSAKQSGKEVYVYASCRVRVPFGHFLAMANEDGWQIQTSAKAQIANPTKILRKCRMAENALHFIQK